MHVDVTKFGNIPDDVGRRYLGKQEGHRNKQLTARTRTVEAPRTAAALGLGVPSARATELPVDLLGGELDA